MRAAAKSYRSSRYAWAFYLAAGAGAVAAYFLLPLPDKARATLDLLFPLACVVATVVAIRWHRPDRLRPWILFTVGMAMFVFQNLIRSVMIFGGEDAARRAPGADYFQSAGYVLIIAALLSLIYSRKGGVKDRSTLVDASIIVVGAAMVAWVFVLAPFAHDDSIPVAERLFKMLYPIANLILLAVSVRLAVSRGARTTAFLLLLLAMVASLIANTLSLFAIENHGRLLPENPINIAFFCAYIFAGAAPLHPSMRTLTDVGAHESRLSRARIGLFLGASLTGLLAYFIERARGHEVDVPVILIGSLVIFMLVLFRLSGLSKEMRRSEERFRSLVQNASDAFSILEPDGTFRYVSPASERVVGFTPEEMTGQSCFALTHPDFVEEARAYFGEVLSHPGRLYEMLLKARHKDGSWQWLQVSCTNLLTDPAVLGIVANFHDVTETKEAEEALRASEHNSRLLFETSPLPMWVFDRHNLDFLAVNDAAIEHYGYTRHQFLSMKITDIRPDDEADRLLEVLANSNGSHSGEWIHRTRDGRLIDVEVVSQALDFSGHRASLVVAQDISDRNRIQSEKENLERQLRQSQKLEAVGQLAGGVAHDFNNLLAVILNYGRFVREDLDEGTPMHEDVSQVLNAAEKAARLVKQLLAFSRREIVKPEVVHLNTVVEDVHKMLIRTIKESINLVVDLSDNLWNTEADRGQMEQVLLNLAVNADAAMPNGGTLEIKTANRSIGEDAAAQKAELSSGDYVCLTVSDDGSGMSDEIAAHIFEPFFTTKAVGEGTGLGLSTVYGIVKQSGGYIYVYSEEGRGTTFNIYLPATGVTERADGVPEVDLMSHGGTESILVVEDEQGVRDITERILRSAGYNVMVAETPAIALALINNGRAVDLLLTDVIMPGLSGRELAQQLQAARPRMKTIFMSGYTDEIIARQGVLDQGVTFLQKPFGPEDLLPLIRETLNGEQAPVPARSLGVLIVDDEQPMREVLKLLLETSKFHVMGEADSGLKAIEMARDLRPDVILLDHFMPGMSGAQTAPALRAASPDSKICAFSAVLSETPAWADAFLSKERIGELPPVIDTLGV